MEASFHVETGVTKVAANGTIRSTGNHPKRIPAPAMTATAVSKAIHHQS